MVSNLFHMRNFVATCLLLLTMLASASTVFSIPITTYRDHVHRSFLALDSVRVKMINGGAATSLDDDPQVTISEIRYMLPPRETVESEGTSLRVDNTWLETLLVRFEDTSISDDERKRLLSEATERLAALDIALAELDKLQNSNASTTSKDEARARLLNIQRRDEYAKKAEDGNALTRIWKRFVTWLRGLFPNAPQIEPGRAKFLSQIAQILIIGLAVAVIAFVMWKFWPRIWRKNPQSKKAGKREARIVLGERLEADQSSADLLAEAEALARDGQLRAAIRKGYIALLCELGDRKVLGLAQHKTNRDYLRSVRNHEQLYREMQIMTNSFENHWYGFVPANIDDWNMFRARYQQALMK